MKTIIFASILTLIAALPSQAQRFAYVDSEYILKNIPDYEGAQKELDGIAELWKQEISKKQQEIDKLYRDFQNEQYLLTEEQKQQRIEEIENKERALKDYQKSKFGYEGELFRKRQELIKPIQDQVYTEIEKFAKGRSYEFIFDKASSTTILYANSKNDKSDDILRNLGHTPKKEE
jgi:outer membrane protein